MKRNTLLSAMALASTASFAQPADTAAFVKLAKQNLTWDFKDPTSAQYRGLYVAKMGDTRVLCGEVNAKNSYGAYGGFVRFYASEDRQFQEVMPSAPQSASMANAMRSAWEQRCANKVVDVE